MKDGIPQGSTLSVTFFAIANNNLTQNIDPAVSKCLYVDDLLIYYSASSMDAIQTILQRTIDTLVEQAH